jgi:hypothetical protein
MGILRPVWADARRGWSAVLAIMEASYRIVSQADGTFAVERTEPGKEPALSGHFKTEAAARAHIADLKKMAPQDSG